MGEFHLTVRSMDLNGENKKSPTINEDSEQNQIKFAHVSQGALPNLSI